jgi:hypothetical protein
MAEMPDAVGPRRGIIRDVPLDGNLGAGQGGNTQVALPPVPGLPIPIPGHRHPGAARQPLDLKEGALDLQVRNGGRRLRVYL